MYVLARTQKKHKKKGVSVRMMSILFLSLSLPMAIRVGLNREHGGLNMTAPARW